METKPLFFLAAAHPAPLYFAAHSSLAQQEVINNLQIGWPWYVMRAAGLIAAILLILLMISGIGLVTGFTYRLLEPLAAWRLHRALGISFLASGAIHVLLLLIDRFVSFNILQVFIPFAATYQPLTIGGINLGSLGTALGIYAMYAGLIVVLTSLFWINSQPKAWRLLHYLSYLLVALVFAHGLVMGTDLRSGFLRYAWIAAGVVLGIGIVSRLRRARTLSRQKGEQ